MGRVKALWEDEVINVHHEVVHGLITKKEAKEKLSRLLDPWEDEDHFHEIAKEDNRSIAATVALLTSEARYEKRREWFQKKKIAIREKFMKLGERKNNETK